MVNTGTGGATRMRGLVESVASNPDALADLRKAAIDSIVREHMGANGLTQGSKLIQFLGDNPETLAELFPRRDATGIGAPG